jgi:hypothetical protein
MAIGDSIYSLLNGDATLVSLVGNDPASGGLKLYPVVIPQGKQVPVLAYEIMADDPTPSKDGASKLDRYDIQIAVYHNNYDEAHTIIERVRTILDDYRGVNSGNDIDKIWYDNRDDAYSEQGDVFLISDIYNLRLKL